MKKVHLHFRYIQISLIKLGYVLPFKISLAYVRVIVSDKFYATEEVTKHLFYFECINCMYEIYQVLV